MIHPPANPAEAQARAAIKAHNIAIAAARQAERKPPLYPLDVRLPLWLIECNDFGVTLMVDDPALCFSGIA